MRAVLFDDEGVLIDDRKLHRRINEQLLREEGLAVEEIGDARLATESDRDLLLRVLEQEGRSSPELLSRLVARKAIYYQERILRDGYPVVEAARELIERCALEGWMLGIVARRRRSEVEGVLAQLGIGDRFKTVITAEDAGDGSDRSRVWLRAFQDLNARPPLPARLLHPHEVAAVVGSSLNQRAAARLSLPTIAVGIDAEASGEASADLHVPTLAALRIADLIKL